MAPIALAVLVTRDRIGTGRRAGLALRAALAAGVVLAAAPALARQHAPDWPEGSATHTAMRMSERLSAAQSRLDERHAALVAQVQRHATSPLDARMLDALQSQQVAWAAYRGAQCELVGALEGGGGTWPTTHAVACEARQTEQRLQTVDAAMACIDALPPQDREFDQRGCLYPLAGPGAGGTDAP